LLQPRASLLSLCCKGTGCCCCCRLLVLVLLLPLLLPAKLQGIAAV
jgi:hypothetical protein